MGFIDSTEKKLGRFAIPGLTMKLAVMQILFFLFYMLNLEFPNNNTRDFRRIIELVNNFNIGNSTLISDFIYILASPPLLPGPPDDFLTYIFMFFAMHLFILFGRSLEELWGDYKFNLYVATAVILGLISSQVFKLVFPEYSGVHLTLFTSVVYMSVFFSFATYFPEFKLLLFFILPTPVRFLAYLAAGLMILSMFSMSNFERFFWGMGTFGAYFLFHYHLAVNRQVQKARKANFDKKVGKLDKQAFHKCKICGKTENDDADLEFRIADDGEEYCVDHLEEAKKNT